MNKTININLGGFFFHIDEGAFQKLRRYLDSISRSLSDDPQGKNEIIADIEARISELLSERITDARQVVILSDKSSLIIADIEARISFLPCGSSLEDLEMESKYLLNF